MKKFYALILAFALVLGFAGAASAAAVEISGALCIYGEWTIGGGWWWTGWDSSTEFATVTFSKTFGDNASASMTLGVAYVPVYWDQDNDGHQDTAHEVAAHGATWDETDPVHMYGHGVSITLNTADYTYKLSDAFSVSAFYNKDGTLIYSSPILGSVNFFGLGIYGGSWYWPGWGLKGTYTFDGGNVWLIANGQAPFAFAAGGSYTADPLVINGAAGFNPGGTFAAGDLTYAITDELKLTGEVQYNSLLGFSVGGKLAYDEGEDGIFAFNARVLYADWLGWTAVAAGGSVKVLPDLLTLSGDVIYYVNPGFLGPWSVKADFTFSEAVSAYVKYAANQDQWYPSGVIHNGGSNACNWIDYISLGLKWVIDGTNSLTFDYYYYLWVPTAEMHLYDHLAVCLYIGF